MFGGNSKNPAAILAAASGAIFALSAQAAPVQGPMESYRDWAIGCDNVGSCTAASLVPEDGSASGGPMTIYIARDAGAQAAPRIELLLPTDMQDMLDLLADGVKFGTAQATGNRASVAAGESDAVIKGIVRGVTLTATAKGKTVGTASLAGASAALRYMDAQQGRAGTVTGLVAKGTLRANAAKEPGRLPLVYRLEPPQAGHAPAALWQEEAGRALALSGCAGEQGTPQDAQIARLSDREELVLIACGAGAYNLSSVPLIATGQAGRRSFALARFDSPPGGIGQSGKPMLVNAGWDAKSATLSSFAKGRGLGDCGIAENYVWDGSAFRLVELRAMKQCRGAWEWITLWRAQALPMPEKKKKK